MEEKFDGFVILKRHISVAIVNVDRTPILTNFSVTDESKEVQFINIGSSVRQLRGIIPSFWTSSY